MRETAVFRAPDAADGGSPAPGGWARPDALLFEVAWEVCAQAGGIYTVLRSKAPSAVRRWGDSYFLIGPYRESSAKIELDPQAPPAGPVADTIAQMCDNGVGLHFGRWLITGRPQVLLVDLGSVRPRLGEWKYLLWKDCGVGSPYGDGEHDDIVCFGFVVADFLQALAARFAGRPLLAHFHEWQGGAALPLLRHRQAPIATVFTTHATLVGRSLSAANADLYGRLPFIDAGATAAAHGFSHRHALEGAAAQAADVFTTVSGITALEAEQFLGRKADVLVPNGLNVERFAAPHEFQELHARSKQRIHEFVMGHFFPSYTFDLDHTLYVFTAGRYEFRNKGLDVFIESLYELNRLLKGGNSTTTIVAFIVTRAAYRAMNVETLNRQLMFNELHDTCEAVQEEMGRRLFQTVAAGHMPAIEDLIDEYAAVRLKRMMYAWRQGPPPTIVTHDLVDDANDPVLRHLRHRGLWNGPDDRVKVVFHPEFMSATSPLFGMDYDQFVRGCHLGVFPSYYEPWGYTPLECIVRGVPAITSDLSGFGDYLMQNYPDHDAHGMFVVPRRYVSFAETVAQVTRQLHQLARMGRRERIALRNAVENQAGEFDWSRLDRHYVAAHQLALERRFGPAHPPVALTPEAPPPAQVDDGAHRPAKRSTRSRRRSASGPSEAE